MLNLVYCLLEMRRDIFQTFNIVLRLVDHHKQTQMSTCKRFFDKSNSSTTYLGLVHKYGNVSGVGINVQVKRYVMAYFRVYLRILLVFDACM